MRIAVISDIHANLPALEAVLVHASRQKASAIWNLGDFVGYGAFPDEVIERLRWLDVPSIIGNYDQKALKVKKKRKDWSKNKIPEKWLAFDWAYHAISQENREYLENLPEQRLIETEGWLSLLVHGSPESIKEHLGPATPIQRLEELSKRTSANLILCGHSHQAFVRQVNEQWFINPGSVGRLDDGDPRAAYAILELTLGHMQVWLHRVDYDVERAASAIRNAGLPESFAQMVLQGRSLDFIEGREAANG
ncbi:MAG TPA: metallophosphoesterase family protein [Anaerolineaceae bacterium]